MVEIKHRDTGQILHRVDAAWLKSADLGGANLDSAHLRHRYLQQANLRAADLRRADLRFTVLHKANMDDARLIGADLYAAVLSSATLRRANLEAANLESTLLCCVDLYGASLRRANLRWANLSGANLTGADLTDADLEHAILDGILGDYETRWPEQFSPARLDGESLPIIPGKPGYRKASTRRIGKPGLGTVRLWSIQEPTVWDRLRQCGVLYTDPDCCDPDFAPAYEWMRQQMARRIPGYQGHNPWWAWFKPKPDLRGSPGRSHFPGGMSVRLELAVPAERVLLSDFMSWHMVLNRFYLSLTDGEGEAWDAELELTGVDQYRPPLPAPWDAWMVASWERVFDLQALAAGGSWSTDLVQATFERLELEHVVGVTEFVTRRGAG